MPCALRIMVQLNVEYRVQSNGNLMNAYITQIPIICDIILCIIYNFFFHNGRTFVTCRKHRTLCPKRKKKKKMHVSTMTAILTFSVTFVDEKSDYEMIMISDMCFKYNNIYL